MVRYTQVNVYITMNQAGLHNYVCNQWTDDMASLGGMFLRLNLRTKTEASLNEVNDYIYITKVNLQAEKTLAVV